MWCDRRGMAVPADDGQSVAYVPTWTSSIFFFSGEGEGNEGNDDEQVRDTTNR